MKILREIISFIICLAAVMSVACPAYAEKPYTYIIVKYSQGISMAEDDQFTLTYEAKGQTGDAKISVRPSSLGKNYGLINLPAGSYLITKIEYSGNSSDIKSQGYACVSSFSVSGNGGANIEIAVGTAETKKLIKAHPDGISVEGKVQDAEAQESDTQDSAADTPDQEKQSDTSSNESSKEKTETKKKVKRKYSGTGGIQKVAVSSLISLVPLVFIFIGGLAFMFSMHKKGKF